MEAKQIVCDVCGEVVDENKYRRHINNAHKEKKEFKCELCQKVFTSNYNLQYHIAQHLNLRNFKCPECPNAYNTAGDLAQHYRVHEKQKDPHRCNQCGMLFQLMSHFKRHLRSHNPEGNKEPKECPDCGKHVLDLKSHNEMVHLNIRNHECSQCSKRFYKKSGLDAHFAMVHLNQKNHVCDLCGKAFGERSLLRKHKRRHDKPQTSFYCTFCRTNIDDIKTHYDSVHDDLKFICNLCYRRFRKKREYDNHMTSRHSNIRNWQCHLCNRSFIKKDQIKRHYQVHLNENGLTMEDIAKFEPIFIGQEKSKPKRNKVESENEDSDDSDENVVKYVSENSATSSESSDSENSSDEVIVKRSMRSRRSDAKNLESPSKSLNSDEDTKLDLFKEPRNDYTCDLCGKSFVQKSLLRKHKNRHKDSSDSLYCSYCKTNVNEIKSHYETVHEDLKHNCEICYRRFRKKREFENHMSLKHSNFRKFKCDKCGKGFMKKYDLKRHYQIHLNESGIKQEDVKDEVIEKGSDDSDYFDNLQNTNDFDSDDDENSEEENANFISQNKPAPLTETVIVDTINVKKEPQDAFTNIEYNFSPSDFAIKDERMSDEEEIVQFVPDLIDDFKEEPDEFGLHSMNAVKDEPVEAEDEFQIVIKCHMCSLVFHAKAEFRKHFMTEHFVKSKLPFSCDECDKSFKDKNSLKKHVKSSHKTKRKAPEKSQRKTSENSQPKATQKPIVECEDCDETFPSMYQLKIHKRTNHKSKGPDDPATLMCSCCGKLWKNKRSLHIHVSTKTGGDFACTICNIKFTYKSDMIRHRDTEHKTGLMHKCNLCSEIRATKAELRLHKKHHHTGDRKNTSSNHMCPICGLFFPNSWVIPHHRRTVHGDKDPDIIRECELCKEVCKDLYYKRRHMALVHLNGKRLKRICGYCKHEFDLYEDFKTHIEAHEGIFICITCGEFFYEAESLKTHQFNHRQVDAKLRNFVCDHCGHRVFTKNQLTVHMLKHMKHSETHTCDICGKGFKFSSSLYTHRKFHGEGEFVCTYCGKKLPRNSDLVIHIRTHTNEKPFKCTVCDRGFTKKLLLTLHHQTHPETRVLYKCKLCDFSYVEKKQLNLHEEQFHPELRPFRCFICDMSFKYEHNLTRHNSHKHL